MRSDGRSADQIRAVKITPDFISQAEGSVLIELGKTRVICTATVNDGVPTFLKGTWQRLGDQRIRNAAPRNGRAHRP